MPLYEYQCYKCGAHYEKIRRFSDPPLTKCERCGGKLEQLLTSPAIRFKGSGFYITDYAKKSASEASSLSGAEEKASNGKSAKPDKPAESAKPSESAKPAEAPKATTTTNA